MQKWTHNYFIGKLFYFSYGGELFLLLPGGAWQKNREALPWRLKGTNQNQTLPWIQSVPGGWVRMCNERRVGPQEGAVSWTLDLDFCRTEEDRKQTGETLKKNETKFVCSLSTDSGTGEFSWLFLEATNENLNFKLGLTFGSDAQIRRKELLFKATIVHVSQ